MIHLTIQLSQSGDALSPSNRQQLITEVQESCSRMPTGYTEDIGVSNPRHLGW